MGDSMPNWKVHLEIGKRLNKSLGLKDNAYQEFLLGNILPDINNSFIVPDISINIEHGITHFDNKNGYRHYLYFRRKYQDKMHEPIYLGYYVHLLTDYLFNQSFYSRIEKENNMELNFNSLARLKQKDFKIFDNNFISNTISLSDIPSLLSKITMDEVKLREEDLVRVKDYLDNPQVFDGKYQMFTEEELEKLLDNVILKITNNIKKYVKR